MKHYLFGGSTAARTLACPSWVTLAENVPKSVSSSIYAEEGTALHTCMEDILDGKVAEPRDLLGVNVGGIDIDVDRLERIEMALSAWDLFCVDNNILDYELEQTFELTDTVGGTTDVLAWSATTVYIVDWKFGQGIEVKAENSAQGMFYGLCAQHHKPELFEDKSMAVAIIQPIPSRQEHETLSVWPVPLNTFKQFRAQLFASIQYDGDELRLSMGDHCTFCPAAAICPQKTGEAVKAARMDPAEVASLSDNLTLALQLEPWIASVKKLAHEQLEIGTKIDGFKLVAKRASRTWTDAEEAEKALRRIVKSSRGENNLKASDILVKPKLLSPAQIEKVLKQKHIDFGKVGDYIASVSSGSTLAPESDKRSAILSTDALKNAMGRIK